MSSPTQPETAKIQEIGAWMTLLINFGLPTLILILLFILLLTGVDGEVKSLMAAVVGWLTKSGVSTYTNSKNGG